MLITWFSWFKVLGRHTSQCRTHRLADGQLLLQLQTLLCTPLPCLQKVCTLLLMAQQLRSLTALLEDLSSLPSTHTGKLTTTYISSPRGLHLVPACGTHIHVAYRNTVDGKPRYFKKGFVQLACLKCRQHQSQAAQWQDTTSQGEAYKLSKWQEWRMPRYMWAETGNAGEWWKLGNTTVKTQRRRHPLPKLWTESPFSWT